MRKAKIENIKDSMPSLIEVAGGYFKSLVSLENNKELIESSSGTIGFLIKLFGKPLIDGYYKNTSKNILRDFGFHTYALAGFNQSAKSLNVIKNLVEADIPINEALLGTNKDFNLLISEIEKKLTTSVFQPRYHPAIQLVKQTVVEMLYRLKIDKNSVNLFKKDFNDGIELTVAETFGESYEEHKNSINKLLFKENETKLLLDIINNSKIGFSESEDLKYEDAFGSWMPIANRESFPEFSTEKEIVSFENSLKKVESLVDEYFEVEDENHLEKILFIVADFGKGKSVFLKKYASSIATHYLNTGEGFFPIYFNLRSFSNYSSETPLGVIEDFLQTEYGIKINSEYFKAKKYVFLIDSLDESCDLSKTQVDKVINSVKRIQSIDKAVSRINKLIITSRPFDDVLFNHIGMNKPYALRTEKSSKETSHYLSLYGFKKNQFNDWLYNTLKKFSKDLEENKTTGYVSEIITAIKNGIQPDTYSILFTSNTLSSSELRRPIFGYMIYQLLINNINITQLGKIGIYLSFLNLLTKEAKYINDPDLKINLKEQFEARNMLHQIAALWLHEKEKGKQGSLKKADICRIIGNFGNVESDQEVLEKYKALNLSDIQFLSHSYFGENSNVLHFQHQSFAEVLIAEYYLKVVIRCALENTLDLDFVITKLNIGLPTEQSIQFLKELLQLVRETIGNEITPDLLEKRKLLTPLLAAIALPINNQTLNSQRLFYEWYALGNIDAYSQEIPEILLTKWFVDKTFIDSISELCEKIINYEENFILSKTVAKTSLIKNEVAHILNKNYKNSIYIEKYLALIIGNGLINGGGEYFIRRLSHSKILNLLKGGNHQWLHQSFQGIKLEKTDQTPSRSIVIDNLPLFDYDFSDSILTNVAFYNCELFRVNFSESQLTNISFVQCFFYNNNFTKCKISGLLDLSTAVISHYGLIPYQLLIKAYRKAFSEKKYKHAHYYPLYHSTQGLITMNRFTSLKEIDFYFSQIAFFINYCFENNYLETVDILKTFPNRKPLFKHRTIEILEEIRQTGSFHSKENLYDDLPF